MKNVKMTINVPEDLYKMIKVQSAVNGSTIREYVIGTISSSMKSGDKKIVKTAITKNLRKKIPNKTTLKALKEYDQGKITKYNNSEELFAELSRLIKNT